MKSIKSIFVAIAVLASFSSYAQGNNQSEESIRASLQGSGVPKVQFNILDKNGDNKLNLKEYKERNYMKKGFKSLDINGDNFVSFNEFKVEFNIWRRHDGTTVAQNNNTKKIKKPKKANKSGKRNVNKDLEAFVTNKFGSIDTDGNGGLSKEELEKTAMLKIISFRAIDRDKNKEVSRKEFNDIYKMWRKAKVATMKARRAEQAKQNKGNYISKPRFNYEELTTQELFDKFDSDKNKKMERSEVTERSLQTDFSRIDTNGDEIITKKELKKYLAKKRS